MCALAVFAVLSTGGSVSVQEPPPGAEAPLPQPPAEPSAPAPARPAEEEAQPPAGETPQETAEADAAAETVVGPTPGAPTLSLSAAVRKALERNFLLQDAADSVSASRWQEHAALFAFVPTVTPVYQRSEERSVFGVDLSQAVPWTGGTVTATGRYLRDDPGVSELLPRTADLRVLLTQPLLRGFGPNASLFNLRNARRARSGQERALELSRQRVAVEVAAAFYDVIAQRQLLEVARQSLARTEALLRSSTARLEVGMASKLDVFRAELQAAQARDAMVRSQAGLEAALERFRGLLALPPGDPVEPEGAALPGTEQEEGAPLEVLVQQALATRLELLEARDQVGDAKRASALAFQNLLPQVDLNVGVTQIGYGSSFGNAWSAGDRRVEVFLSAALPINQPAERANRAVAQLQVGARERGVAQRELEVEQEVRRALRDLDQIRKSVELQRKAVDVAAQQRRLAVLRYQRGLGSNFDVIDAEGSLVTARSALVSLLTTYAVARLDLRRATGTLDVLTEFQP
jgi:outer membrane protein TolC